MYSWKNDRERTLPKYICLSKVMIIITVCYNCFVFVLVYSRYVRAWENLCSVIQMVISSYESYFNSDQDKKG